MEPATTDDFQQELLAILYRIAAAFERAYPMPPPQVGTTQLGYCATHGEYVGWQCPSCSTGITPGYRRWSSGGSYTTCSTPNCYLQSGHAGICQIAIVTN